MKKIKYWTAALIFGIILTLGVYYLRLPEYKVYCSITSTGADFRETDLHVVVYKPWNMEETAGKIVAQYKKMNGVPSQLTLHFYHSSFDADQGNVFYEIIFRYDDDEVTQPPMV